MSRVGEKIKKARLESSLSQKQLAKKLGVSESFINDVECGRKIINEALISRVSKILNKDINDISMSFEEQDLEEKAEKKVYAPKETLNKKSKEEVNEVWSEAFGEILRNVPVYDYSMTRALEFKKMPVIDNKIEGHGQDKVFFLSIQDDEMMGFRVAKGDIAFCHSIKEIENNSICLIEMNGKRAIRQIKRLDSNKILLISNKNNLKTETLQAKDIKVIGKLDKVEIKL